VGVEIVNYVVPCSLSAALYSPDTDGLFLGVVVRDTKAGSPAHEPSRWHADRLVTYLVHQIHKMLVHNIMKKRRIFFFGINLNFLKSSN